MHDVAIILFYRVILVYKECQDMMEGLETMSVCSTKILMSILKTNE